MNKPRIYSHCKAGCQWETVHKSDFRSITVSIAAYKWVQGDNGYVFTETVADLFNEDIVIIDAPYELYSSYGLNISQNGNKIIFTCNVKPSSIVSISIAIISAVRAVEE